MAGAWPRGACGPLLPFCLHLQPLFLVSCSLLILLCFPLPEGKFQESKSLPVLFLFKPPVGAEEEHREYAQLCG